MTDPQNFGLFFFSLALFAFWLRSSVVSVLFSLISETFLRELLRLSTFWIHRGPLSLLMPSVSVASIALPLADANLAFHQFLRLRRCWRRCAFCCDVLRVPPVMSCCYAAMSAPVRVWWPSVCARLNIPTGHDVGMAEVSEALSIQGNMR